MRIKKEEYKQAMLSYKNAYNGMHKLCKELEYLGVLHLRGGYHNGK